MRDNLNVQAWPDRRLLDLLKLEIPIVQAPMAGSDSVALARTVSSTGALGSLACPLLSPDQVREAVRALRQGMTRPFNLNFFCHTMEAPDAAAIQKWRRFLGPHYDRLGIDIESVGESRLRLPFNDDMCTVVEESRPEVVSFHFGLPNPDLIERLKRHGIKILSSATSVREAKWLVSRGCDAIIAQGFEAGGHRGMFLETNIATQLGLFALATSSSGRSFCSSHSGRRHCRRERHCCGPRPWRIRGAVGHCVSVLPRSQCISSVSSSA